jgi:hypothetical protein
MIVKFIKTIDPEDGYEIENLTINKEYEVIGIEADDFRIIDDKNEPILFSPDCFEIVNSNKPTFWVTEIGEDGEEYSYPPNWNETGFFEDFFDGVKHVKDQFWKDYRKYYHKNSS